MTNSKFVILFLQRSYLLFSLYTDTNQNTPRLRKNTPRLDNISVANTAFSIIFRLRIIISIIS